MSTEIETQTQVTVEDKFEGAEGVVFLKLAPEDGAQLSPWEPGAHIDLHLANGLTRQYSLCGDPDDLSSYTVGVLNAPTSRGGSKFVHESLNIGDSLRITGPRNHFKLVDAENYIFIAGGIGITPIAAMLRETEAKHKQWSLMYGGRTLDSMALVDEFSKYGEKVTLWPQDSHGIIDLPSLLANPQPGTVVYVCGPEPLLAAVEAICEQSWPAGSLHLERFAAKKIEAPVNKEFEIEIASSGKVIQVPANMSALQALSDEGIHIISSCQEGTCGTCDTGVLSGEVDHRDSVLTREEQSKNDCMMVCVSRANCARLVLDL